MNHKRLSAAWVLAAVLVSPASYATDFFAIRTIAGLPRAGVADGQATAWRNVGIVAESALLDAEVTLASCFPTSPMARAPSELSSSACATPAGEPANGSLGHEFALTFKIPRWAEGAPLVDLSMRSWHASSRVATPGERNGSSVAELVVTQPLGAIATFIGYSTPMALGSAASGWRSTFAGVTWYVGPGTRLEFVADRGEGPATSGIDRTMKLGLVHAAPARNARFAAWTKRALDNRTDRWQVGAGVELAF